MTKPDTLASLIETIPHTNRSGTPCIENDWAHRMKICKRCRLEAALDALVEKWTAEARDISKNKPSGTEQIRGNVLWNCIRDLRGEE